MPDTTFNAVNISLRNYLFAQILGNLATAVYAVRGDFLEVDDVTNLAWKLAVAGEAKILSESEKEPDDQN